MGWIKAKLFAWLVWRRRTVLRVGVSEGYPDVEELGRPVREVRLLPTDSSMVSLRTIERADLQ